MSEIGWFVVGFCVAMVIFNVMEAIRARGRHKEEIERHRSIFEGMRWLDEVRKKPPTEHDLTERMLAMEPVNAEERLTT